MSRFCETDSNDRGARQNLMESMMKYLYEGREEIRNVVPSAWMGARDMTNFLQIYSRVC